MMNLNRLVIAAALALISLPIAASAKVTCESLQSMIDVPDDQCEAISDSARRCFTALDLEYFQIRKIKDKDARSKAANELVADYNRELANWRGHYVYISRLGEGRACTDQTAEVEVYMEEMNRDLKALLKRNY